MVVGGQLGCSVDGEWKFEIDKNMLSRIMPQNKGSGLWIWKRLWPRNLVDHRRYYENILEHNNP